MYPAATSVKPLDGHRLLVGFDNGERRIFDVTPYLGLGIFAQLRDAATFNAVRVCFDTVEWPRARMFLWPDMR